MYSAANANAMGKHGHLFANSTNSKQAARMIPTSRARPVVLNIGLVVAAMKCTFERVYYCPNPDKSPHFHVTDMEVWNPEGEKLLIEALGDDKACNFALAVT